eukprot:9058627-Ditylum_brightwellii.AAC.1
MERNASRPAKSVIAIYACTLVLKSAQQFWRKDGKIAELAHTSCVLEQKMLQTTEHFLPGPRQ